MVNLAFREPTNFKLTVGQKPILYEARYGALTELYAGLSTDIKIEQTGAWIQPWGRITKGRSDLEDAQLAQKYWDWCEQQVKDYHRP